MTELELTVRTIQDMVPEMQTTQLQKWKGILTTALAHVDKELKATHLHTCKICFLQEWGYRDELPSAWYQKGQAEVCFQHDYNEAEKLLKEAGFEDDAWFPPEVTPPSVGALEVAMNTVEPPKSEADHTLQELMDLI